VKPRFFRALYVFEEEAMKVFSQRKREAKRKKAASRGKEKEARRSERTKNIKEKSTLSKPCLRSSKLIKNQGNRGDRAETPNTSNGFLTNPS